MGRFTATRIPIRGPHDTGPAIETAIFDAQRAPCQVETVFGQRNSEGPCEISGPSTEAVDVDAGTQPAALGHQPDVVDRFERPNEDGRGAGPSASVTAFTR